MEPAASSRAADLPRTASIVESAELLERTFGRPLRVLDLGSSQGYIAFVLAEHGHHVTGIDYLPINVQVARAIHDRHPELDVAFIDGDITAATLVTDWMTSTSCSACRSCTTSFTAKGWRVPSPSWEHPARHVEHGLFEMALRTEPMYWAASQPSDPRVVADVVPVHQADRIVADAPVEHPPSPPVLQLALRC